jgi:glycosyltransferase involved in cell wall biosynthesis
MNKQISNLVSIVIVNYNAGKLLSDCIETIFKTDYDNYEVILVDNASTDTSYKKCKEKFNDIHLIVF